MRIRHLATTICVVPVVLACGSSGGDSTPEGQSGAGQSAGGSVARGGAGGAAALGGHNAGGRADGGSTGVGSGGRSDGTGGATNCDLASLMPSYPWPGEETDGPLTGGTLEACGWPGPTNTGPAPGSALIDCAEFAFDPKKVDGSGNPNVVHHDGGECWLEIRVPATVEGVRGITGAYLAADLTLRNCELASLDSGTPSDVGMVNVQSGTTFTADHVRVDGGAHTGERPFFGAGGSIVVRYSEFVHCGAACVEGDLWDVRDSYLHDFVGIQGNHVDGLQIGSGGPVTAIHNTIIALNSWYDATEGPVPNSTLGLWAELGDTDGVTVENNLLAGGGGTVYLQEKAPDRMTHVRVSGNRFSLAYYPHDKVGWVGFYGPLYPSGIPAGVDWTDNSVLETGAALSIEEAVSHWH